MNTEILKGDSVRVTAVLAIVCLLLGCSGREHGATGESGTPAPAQTEVRSTGERFDARELQVLLRERNSDTLSKSLNTAKRLGVTPDGLLLLRAVWTEARGEYPDLAWQTLAVPEVRLNIIDLLQQAMRNGELAQEIEGAHNYVVKILNSGIPRDVSQAAMTLAIFDNESDVPLLEQIAVNGNQQTARPAIIALSRMCSPAADAALARIESAASDSDKAFLNDTRSKMADFKKRSGVCRS